jgi:hypothetical protein
MVFSFVDSVFATRLTLHPEHNVIGQTISHY